MQYSFTIPFHVFNHPGEEIYPIIMERLTIHELAKLCCIVIFSGIYKPSDDNNNHVEQIMNIEESIVELLILQRMFNDDDDVLIKATGYIASIIFNIRGHLPYGFYTYKTSVYLNDSIIVVYDYYAY